MKLALVDGQRREATPDLPGKCPSCGATMVAKCGDVRVWHWAHLGKRHCDFWWEPETEWHRDWKNQFPREWQEITHQAKDGEKHIADVKTDHGWVIEFPHSYIRPEELRSRDTFYPKLVWVVDGLRRKRDRVQFLNASKEGVPVGANSAVRRVVSDECTILREWAGSHALVFFDFGDEQVLFWRLAVGANGAAYVAPFSRAEFIDIYRNGATQAVRNFDELVKDLSNLVAQYESHLRAQALKHAPRQPLRGFRRYLARREKFRRRF